MTTSDGMPAGWVNGVDGSYAELTVPIAQALRASGIEVWWQCLWTGRERPPNALGNLSVARFVGMAIAGYCSVTAVNPGWWHANQAREGVPDDLWADLRVVPCDVELDNIPEATVRQCVDRLAELGKRRAIYTSWDAWVKKMGDSQAFDDCLLCNALWDAYPDVDFSRLPYGGWRDDQVLLEQYTGGTEVEGILVDRDVWNRALLYADGTEGEMDAPTKGEFGALYALVLRDVAVTTAIANAVADMAVHVYTEDEPLIVRLREKLDELAAEHAKALAAMPGAQPP
jgi:hypothetical protein